MAYNKFTKIRKQFDITVLEEPVLFTHISAVEPSDMLRYFLKRHIPEAIGTEKAKIYYRSNPFRTSRTDSTSNQSVFWH
jgi:hypothetical protein